MDTTNSFPAGNGAAGDTMLNKAAAGVHGAVNTLAGAADEASHKIKPAIERVAGAAHQAVEKVAGVAAPTAAWLSETGDTLKATQRKVADGTRKIADGTANYVSSNPWKALGIALAAGFLIRRVIR